MIRGPSVAEDAPHHRLLVFKVGNCPGPFPLISLPGRVRPGPVVTVPEMKKSELGFANPEFVVQSLY
jgi:hypothetical protein